MPLSSPRNRILRASAKLFATYGFKGTTTRAIAAEANTSLSVIHSHFPSKELLYQAVIDQAGLAYFESSSDVICKIKQSEKAGTLHGENAWLLIVELIDSLIDYAFNEDYVYELQLIHNEFAFPQFLSKYPLSSMGVYRILEELFAKYLQTEKKEWMSYLSYTIINTAFLFSFSGDFSYHIIGLNADSIEDKNKVKFFLRKYILSSIESNLKLYQ